MMRNREEKTSNWNDRAACLDNVEQVARHYNG